MMFTVTRPACLQEIQGCAVCDGKPLEVVILNILSLPWIRAQLMSNVIHSDTLPDLRHEFLQWLKVDVLVDVVHPQFVLQQQQPGTAILVMQWMYEGHALQQP